MALYNVSSDIIVKGKSEGGSRGFAAYLTRENALSASQERRYLERDGHGATDLVASGSGHLPAWAKSAEHFWESADRYEREGSRTARTYRITLPHELSNAGRLALSQDIRAAFFARYPHTWALHAPTQVIDGQERTQPHLHVMFSTRREDAPRGLSPERWFRSGANQHTPTEQQGITKDRAWNQKWMLQGVRAECAVLINAALEREGWKIAVSQERLAVQDFDRPPERAHSRGAAVLWKRHGDDIPAEWTPEKQAAYKDIQREWHATLAQREATKDERLGWEPQMAWIAWQQQKQEEHIRDLRRGAMVDLVRDRFWQNDKSPAREQERLESIARAIARERELTGRFFPSPTPERQRTPGRLWLPGHLDDTPQGGAHLHMDEHERSYQR